MADPLKPVPRVWLRVVLLLVVTLVGWLSSIPWPHRIFGLVFWSLVFGTYPVTEVRDERLYRQYFAAFLPWRARSWSLQRCIRIEVSLAEQTGIWSYILFGPVNYVFFLIFDWLFPWIGGSYRIWLRGAKGGRLLVWQGNSDAAFQANLRFLEALTGLPIQRVGDVEH